MDTTTKDKTIDSLLTQRATLVKQMCSVWASSTQHLLLPKQIEVIDGLIKQLNGIK